MAITCDDTASGASPYQSRRSLARRALLLALVCASTCARAWGPEAHRTVGALADQLLIDSRAAQHVHALLGTLTLADASVWADCAKGVDVGTLTYQSAGQYPYCAPFETASGEAELADFVRRNFRNCTIKPGEEVCHRQYHYSDVAIQRGEYRVGWVGTRDDDVVAAISAATRVLQGDPPPQPFDFGSRRVALMLLTHYVGDLHQPLHVGAIYLSPDGRSVDPDRSSFDPATTTRGGNSVYVRRARERNLHAIWDSIPKSLTEERIGLRWLATAREVPPAAGSPLTWPVQWASESVREAQQAFAGLSFEPQQSGHWTVTLPSDYRRSMNQTKRQQLIRGGARLAQLLRAVWPDSGQ